VFENLGRTEILAFATCAVPDRAGEFSASQAPTLIDALARFCAWARRTHEVAPFGDEPDVLDELRESLPRVQGINERLSARQVGADDQKLFELISLDDGVALLEELTGRRHRCTIDRTDAELEPRDYLRARRRGNAIELIRVYPPQMKELLATISVGLDDD